jgi:midasin (ATPase involved in ribosome maturation)
MMATKAVTVPSAIENPWHLVLAVAPHVRRLLLRSETPGTGKTTAGILLAEAQQAECIVITMTDSMTASDLLGHWIPQGSEFVWHDGPMTRALRRRDARTVVVWNELGNAGPDVQHIAFALLEEGKAAQFTLPNNEVLTVPAGLTIVATMNQDPTEVLPPAVLNRFEVSIDVGSHVSPMILEALPASLRSMVADGRMMAREAFSLVHLTGRGCDPFVAVQAVLGTERATDYGDALAIALAS